jgi:hypothetical protein
MQYIPHYDPKSTLSIVQPKFNIHMLNMEHFWCKLMSLFNPSKEIKISKIKNKTQKN